MYERILIPTDGSDAVEPAIDQALGLAGTYGATVHVLSVVEPVVIAEADEKLHRAMEQVSQDTVEAVADRAANAGCEAVTAVRTGVAHDEIVAYVRSHDIDLVVMGTHGRTGLGRYLLGSTTERLVRLSPVPVLTVRAAEDETETETDAA
jgi:nucleotide-binding universal stress UspA family protein